MNYGYHESLWIKWMEQSTTKKVREKQQELIKPFLKPGQLPLDLTTKQRNITVIPTAY